MPSSHPLPRSCHWFSRLASALDPRSAPRLAWLLVGAILARGRRTVTSWIRAAGLSGEYRPCYTTVAAAGKEAGLTAHVERFFGTVRQRCARFVRKTLSFSKKVENHVGALWFFIRLYNSCR